LAKTKEEKAAYCRAWRAAHLEQKRARDRAWRVAHREQSIKNTRAWRAAHQEQSIKNARAWRAAHPEEFKVRVNIGRQRRIGLVELFQQRTGCRLCGWQGPSCCFDGHHIRGEKKFSLGHATNHAEKDVIAECNKTITLCAHCHRQVHAGLIKIPAALLAPKGTDIGRCGGSFKF
jgi:hypothetical protein